LPKTTSLYFWYLLFAFYCICTSLFGQKTVSNKSNELGTPFIQNFGPRDYNASAKTYRSIFQDDRGFMYFNNISSSTLHFDGVNWNMLYSMERIKIKKTIQAENGKLYFIADNSLGILETPENGWPYQKDLSSEVFEKVGLINKMINCFAKEDKVYFISDKHIFVLSNGIFSIIPSNKTIKKAFYHNNKIYLLQEGNELALLDNKIIKPQFLDVLFLEKNLLHFISDTKNADRLIIATDEGTLFSKTKNSTKKLFSIPHHYQINTKTNNPVVILPNGEFVISIENNGILHCDAKGRIIQLINSRNGLPSDKIIVMFLDRSNGLWVSHHEGISRIDISSNISQFDNEKLGWEGVTDLQRFKDKLYFGTPKGLFMARSDSTFYASNKKLNRISPTDLKIYDLEVINKNLLLAATNKGIFKIDNDQFIPSFDDQFVSRKIRKSSKGDWVYIGTENGVRLLRKDKLGIWKLSKEVYLDNSPTIDIEEDNNNLWINNSKAGYIKVQIKYDDHTPVIDSTMAIKYLPELENMGSEKQVIFTFKEKLFFGGYEQLLQFNYDSNKLTPYKLLSKEFFAGSYKDIGFYPSTIFSKGNEVYYLTNYMPYAMLKGKYNEKLNKIAFEKKIYSKIKIKAYPNNIYFDKDSVLWLMDKNLYRIDQKRAYYPSKKFKSYISQVLVDKDSTISNLFYTQKAIKLPDTTRSIKFKFGAPTYHEVKNTKFKFYLEGYDDGFQPYFIYNNQTQYENLGPGTYTFHLIAKNQEQIVGEKSSFTFSILPPWYQSNLAYLFYGLLLLLFIWGLVKWRTRQIVNKNVALEHTIAQRTEELAEKNKRLKNLDDAKSRFFANVSHEFRTPLTLILGPLEKKLTSTSHNEDDVVMHRNAKRLQELINQLLEISKLESGEIDLKVSKGDLNAFIKILANSFTSLATTKNIEYQVNIAQTDQDTWFDKDKLEKIINNLLSNAFKFTPENNKITFSASFIDNHVQIIIKDSGIGIPKDKLPYLFERFYQVDSSDTREQEGTGIGLALVNELVQIYGGKIEVSSEVNEGTTFTVSLPVNRALFHEDNINLEAEIHSDTIQNVASSPDIRIEQKDIAENDNNDRSILVVEDNDDLRRYIITNLKGDYKILEASDGQEGLALAIRDIPDLIITDVMMPKMNGEELCKRIKTDTKTSHIPVLMLTAKADQKSKIQGLRLGAEDYISKPFSVEELNVRVNNLITTREKLKEIYQKKIIINPSDIETDNQDERFLQELSGLVEENMSNPALDVEFLTDRLHMSRTQLHRKLKALAGISTTEFIRSIRLKRAAQLLEQNADSPTQIGYQVGFSDHSYFAKCFRKQYGVAPSKYSSKTK